MLLMGACICAWIYWICMCVCVCVHSVLYSHAKQLATSEEAWPALCMFQRVALHVSRSTASQNPNHTHKACVHTHTQTYTQELWLKGLRLWESMCDGCKDQMCL